MGSTLTMYSRPGYENSSPIITNSLYQGIDWGNDKITFNENTKLITAGDYVYQYLYYRIGYKKCNEILKGSNKGLLTYFNYDSNLYKYRQESSSFFIKKDDNVYFYYYSLMKYKTAYAKYESKNLGINEESLKNKKNNKIYDSTGFVVFNLNELEIDILAKSVEQQNVKL
ncbi:MAG: hypothetical protein HF975_16935 [ANME-2 cluster archaeon]|nr:hypothetical protein [ANME-2 cluster archaeon]